MKPLEAGLAAIKPIETAYAGHRFRSRLEARWAVFFDTLGISWEYEPQGYELGGGSYTGSAPGGTGYWPIRRYLPDFWLTDFSVWVEVKGQIDVADMLNLGSMAYDSWVPGSSLPGDGLILVGELPDTTGWGEHRAVTHPYFHWYKGLGIKPIQFTEDGLRAYTRGFELKVVDGSVGPFVNGQDDIDHVRLNPYEIHAEGLGLVTTPPRVRAAYTAARSARFEHGERGR